MLKLKCTLWFTATISNMQFSRHAWKVGSPLSRDFSDFPTMYKVLPLEQSSQHWSSYIGLPANLDAKAITCLISVNTRKLFAYLRMNFFLCDLKLVLPP